jgi:hypothetical protein
MNARISPDTAINHHGLRDDFRAFAEQHHCVFQDYGYESRSDYLARQLLGRIQDNTALYIRGAPDAWLACKNSKHPRGVAIQVEFKSRQGDKQNMALEAQPLASAIQRSRPPLSVRVLYAYRDPELGDCGFWCSEPPRFVSLRLGPKDDGIHEYVRRCFKNVPIGTADGVNGSGDSFVLVNNEEWLQLPDWRDQLRQLLYEF